jgi:hypothetical protein
LARAAQRMARMDSDDDDDDDGFWCERMWIYLTYFDILDDQIWIDTVDGAMSPWFGLGLQLHDAAWPWPVRHSRLCFVCSHSVRNLTGRRYHDIIMHVKCWETRTQWEMILATIWDICTNSLNVFPALVVFFMFFSSQCRVFLAIKNPQMRRPTSCFPFSAIWYPLDKLWL